VNGPRKLRVLHLGSPTGMYGAERWILALVRHLPASRVESIVGVVKDVPDAGEPPLCVHAAALGARTHVFEAPGKLSWHGIRQIRRFLVDNEVDILHTHYYKTDVMGALAARGTRSKTVSTPHGWSTNAGLKAQFYELVDRLALPFFDAVVPLSAELRDGLRRVPGVNAKLQLILNGVDIAEIDSVADIAPEVQRWRSEGDLIIGYIGQLIPRKGLVNLIRAFDALDIPGKRLCLIGDGPQRAELEAVAAAAGSRDRVHFFGYRQDRISLLKGFDVFVLPSALEGIPRCLLEAMAAGVAVAASDVPGCADIVSSDETGLLFPCGDEPALVRVMTRLASRDLRSRLVTAAQALVLERYSASRMAKEYVELYGRLCSERVAAAGSALESQK
jgi:glycosyltransferase involved in cell wall biosynthesis